MKPRLLFSELSGQVYVVTRYSRRQVRQAKAAKRKKKTT